MAKQLFERQDLDGARDAFCECVDMVQKKGFCPLARADLGAVLHANIAEICVQLEDVILATQHASEAILLCPQWERG